EGGCKLAPRILPCKYSRFVGRFRGLRLADRLILQVLQNQRHVFRRNVLGKLRDRHRACAGIAFDAVSCTIRTFTAFRDFWCASELHSKLVLLGNELRRWRFRAARKRNQRNTENQYQRSSWHAFTPDEMIHSL